MNRITWTMGLVLLGSASILAAQQPSPVMVSISTPTAKYLTGATVKVTVIVRNITDHVVTVSKALGVSGQADATNRVVVYDSKGRALPHLGEPLFRSTDLVSLEPGRSFQDYFILNNIVDIREPGRYKVQVLHLTWPSGQPRAGDHKVRIPSNTLTIFVTR